MMILTFLGVKSFDGNDVILFCVFQDFQNTLIDNLPSKIPGNNLFTSRLDLDEENIFWKQFNYLIHHFSCVEFFLETFIMS